MELIVRAYTDFKCCKNIYIKGDSKAINEPHLIYYFPLKLYLKKKLIRKKHCKKT